MLTSILQGLGKPGLCLIHSIAGILIRIFSVVFIIPATGIRGYFYGIFLGELLLTLLHVKALKFPYRQSANNRL
jgi:stage V sporulation protein B